MNVSGVIRAATDNDLEIIHQWLLKHQCKNVSDTFLCNWELTKNVCSEGNLLVFIDDVSNKPIAYLWKDFGILEVHNDYRLNGIGTKLVEYGLGAQDSDVSVIKVECSPSTSIPFWQHMGFTVYSEKYAYKIIEKNLELPSNGQEVELNINFYPESKQWQPEIEAIESFSPQAVRTTNGRIRLASRVSIFSGKPEWNNKPLIGIVIDGKEVFIGKAQSNKARNLGVKAKYYSFSIEEICVQENE